MKKLLTQKELKERLLYNLESGKFTNKKNGRMVGFYTSNSRRILINVMGKNYYAHILAFLYVDDKFPEHKIRHVNNCTFDNRWNNLVETSLPKAKVTRTVRSKIGKWWTDQNGNKWSTKRLMKKYSKTMTDCTGCIDCRNCHGCTGCVGCTDCHRSVNCYGCTGCTECHDCCSSINCVYCTECHSCSECVGCSDYSNRHLLTRN